MYMYTYTREVDKDIEVDNVIENDDDANEFDKHDDDDDIITYKK